MLHDECANIRLDYGVYLFLKQVASMEAVGQVRDVHGLVPHEIGSTKVKVT